MTGDAPKPEDAELERLAEDWITLWQTEIAALAADREAAEAWAAVVSTWAALGAAWLRAAAAPPSARAAPPWPAPHDATTPRPTPAAAPSDPGRGSGVAGDGGGDDGLRQRIAELERRLANLESGAGRTRPDPRPPRRSKPRA